MRKLLAVLLIISLLTVCVQPIACAQSPDADVRGAWSTAGHSALADAMTGLANADVIKVISEACDSRAYLQSHPANAGITNAKDFKYRGSNAYHAIGNYVAAARYLYALARFYQYGTPVDFTAFDAALTGIGRSYEPTNRQDIGVRRGADGHRPLVRADEPAGHRQRYPVHDDVLRVVVPCGNAAA